jgi:hypothetical protein
MTTPESDEVTYFLTQLSSPDVQDRALSLRSQAARPLADRRLLARAEELLADTTLCLLELPFRFGEVRWRAVEAVASLRAALDEVERVELRDVLVPLTANQAMRLAVENNVSSSQPGTAGVLECMEVLRQRGLLPTRDVIGDPAYARLLATMPSGSSSPVRDE